MRRPFTGVERTTWARMLALAVLIAGFVDLTSAFFPQRCDLADLIGDVRRGRTDQVQVYYVEPGVAGAVVAWSLAAVAFWLLCS